MTKSLVRAGALLPPFLFGLGPFPALADGFQEEETRQEHVQVTATRREVDQLDVSAAVTGVEAADIRSANADVIAGALRGQAGTFFQQTTPGQGIPVIRGLKGSQILHLVDGMRLNNAFFRNAPNQYLGLVDPLVVGRIEVVRGASGALYGSDAMGGVVNFVLPDPETGAEKEASSRLFSAWSSADHGLTGRFETNVSAPGQGLKLGASYQQRGNRETGSGETLVPSAFRSRSVDFNYLKQFGDAADFKLTAQVLEQPSTPRIDELVAGFGQDAASSEEYYFEPNRREWLSLRYRRHGNTWYDDFSVSVARQVIDDDRRTRDRGSDTRTLERNESTMDGLTLQFDSNFASGAHLTWGLEYYDDTVRSMRDLLDLPGGASRAAASRFPDRSEMTSIAVFASADFHAGDRLNIGGGLRYSRFRIRLPEAATSPAVSLDPDDFSGDLHFSWTVSRHSRLVANIGRGFRSPNIFDLGTLGSRPGNRFNIANPDLGPESVLNVDLGFKHEAQDWDAEIFVYHMDYRDKITSVATGEITPQGRIVVRSENRDEVEIKGIEAGARWRSSASIEWSAVLNYTHGTETDPAGPALPADRIPPLNGRLGWKWSPGPAWKVRAWLLFASAQDRLSARDGDDPRIDPEGTPGWKTVNLSVEHEFTNESTLGVRLGNVFDEAYREHGSGIDAVGRDLGIWFSTGF